MDTSQQTIKQLFYRQIRDLTIKSIKNESLDLQFSDKWI